MTRARLGQVLTWLGRLLTVAALIFLVRAFSSQWQAVADRDLPARLWVGVAGLGLVYGCLMLLVAEAWHHILGDLGDTPIGRRRSWPSYAVTQIAKYLPGNVFHYVGRVAWLRRDGVSAGVVVPGMLWEVLALLAAALSTAAVLVLVFPLALVTLEPATMRNLALAGLFVLVVAIAVLFVRPRAAARFAAVSPSAATLALVVAILIGFFLGQAGVFTALAALVSGRLVPALLAVAVLAWTVGFVTPGAPAGVGVREATILVAAGPMLGPADALLVAALFRLVTTLGDGVCAGIGWAIHKSNPAGIAA